MGVGGNGPCTCPYASICDESHVNNFKASAIENKFVYQVYDNVTKSTWCRGMTYSQIAEHFSDTRFKAWPRVSEFLASLPHGSILADVGCGNGKYLYEQSGVFKVRERFLPPPALL